MIKYLLIAINIRGLFFPVYKKSTEKKQDIGFVFENKKVIVHNFL
jgi:hypothetical protein